MPLLSHFPGERVVMIALDADINVKNSIVTKILETNIEAGSTGYQFSQQALEKDIYGVINEGNLVTQTILNHAPHAYQYECFLFFKWKGYSSLMQLYLNDPENFRMFGLGAAESRYTVKLFEEFGIKISALPLTAEDRPELNKIPWLDRYQPVIGKYVSGRGKYNNTENWRCLTRLVYEKHPYGLQNTYFLSRQIMFLSETWKFYQWPHISAVFRLINVISLLEFGFKIDSDDITTWCNGIIKLLGVGRKAVVRRKDIDSAADYFNKKYFDDSVAVEFRTLFESIFQSDRYKRVIFNRLKLLLLNNFPDGFEQYITAYMNAQIQQFSRLLSAYESTRYSTWVKEAYQNLPSRIDSGRFISYLTTVKHARDLTMGEHLLLPGKTEALDGDVKVLSKARSEMYYDNELRGVPKRKDSSDALGLRGLGSNKKSRDTAPKAVSHYLHHSSYRDLVVLIDDTREVKCNDEGRCYEVDQKEEVHESGNDYKESLDADLHKGNVEGAKVLIRDSLAQPCVPLLGQASSSFSPFLLSSSSSCIPILEDDDEHEDNLVDSDDESSVNVRRRSEVVNDRCAEPVMSS